MSHVRSYVPGLEFLFLGMIRSFTGEIMQETRFAGFSWPFHGYWMVSFSSPRPNLESIAMLAPHWHSCIQCLCFVFLAIKGVFDFVLHEQTTFHFSLPSQILRCCGSSVTHPGRWYWSFKVHCRSICNLSHEAVHAHITGAETRTTPGGRTRLLPLVHTRGYSHETCELFCSRIWFRFMAFSILYPLREHFHHTTIMRNKQFLR